MILLNGLTNPLSEKLLTNHSVTLINQDTEMKEQQTEKQIKVIDVPDYKGKGMDSVAKGQALLFQNIAEAEYAVALYMFHRLKQHSVEEGKVNIKESKILIVTTEEGQKRLIEELLKQKCEWHPMLGLPQHQVKTVEELLDENVDTTEFDLVIVSTVWTSLQAPALVKDHRDLNFVKAI